MILSDGTTVSDCTLTINATGTLQVEYGLNNLGATLDDVQAQNLGAIQVGTMVAEDPTLTLDDGTTISGGALSIDSGSTLDIEVGPVGQGGANGPGYPDATLDGVTVANNGTINVDLAALGAVLTLDDGATIEGGTLTIGTSEGNGSGTVDIELGPNDITNPDATLDGVTVNNYAVIEVGQSTSATLLLDDGTTVYGGSLLIGNTTNDTDGTLDIEAGPNGPGATLDGVTVNSSSFGAIEVGQIGRRNGDAAAR